jgi:HlyD family secretion protein
MRIPDLRRMMVMTRVHESMVSRIRGDTWKQTGFTEQARAAMLMGLNPMANLIGQHAFFDSTRDYLREKYRKHVQYLESEGHSATIRVDAFPDQLFKGRIKSVATVASQQDWMSTDVKVYQDGGDDPQRRPQEQVRRPRPRSRGRRSEQPGYHPQARMSAEVTITIENLAEQVLTIPVQAVVGGTELGDTRKCFVMTEGGPVERLIKLGLSNERVVEVREGLREGEQVVINPRALVGDKVKTRDQRSDEGKGEPRQGPGRLGQAGRGRSPAGRRSGRSPAGRGRRGGPKSGGIPAGPPAGVGPGRKPISQHHTRSHRMEPLPRSSIWSRITTSPRSRSTSSRD